MSAKRAAPTELNHENWDQDDPSEHEEMGKFKTASKGILEKRVIRTAKRRAPMGGDESKKGVFSGFGGFNKSQPSSFDFLANLTNGNKNNSSPLSKSDTAVTSSLFSSKPLSSSPGSSIFVSQASSTPTKSIFGIATSQSSTLFGTNTAQATTSLFTASKADSTVGDSPFKTQPVSSSNEAINTNSTKTTNAISNPSGSQVTSTIFGAPNLSANVSNSLFSNTSNTPFKIQPVSSSTTLQSSFGTSSKTVVTKPNETGDKKESQNEDKKMKYYAKLKGLNESVCDWIKKHVEETPLCILTPIFRDYEKYLKEMQDEYQGTDEEDKLNKDTSTASVFDVKPIETNSGTNKQSIPAFTSNNLNSSPFTKTELSPSSKLTAFGSPTNGPSLVEKSKLSFGINTESASSGTATTIAGFSFGITTTQPTATTATSPLSTTGVNSAASTFLSTSTANSNGSGAAPFSFGIGKPFSFNSNIQKPATDTTENDKDNNDEPPKVEFTPVVEENSVYDKRCKIFVKKDGNFVDKGVGTLYIKKVEESGKHQLLVRANTNLGNVLVNLILASAIPTQRMGKNNVMLVCIPTPDAKPPPTPILIRVKTSEEADELLETLNKFKT